MSLRIVAYTQMKEVVSPVFDDEGYPVGRNVWLPGLDMRASEPFWPGRSAPLQYWRVYSYKSYKIIDIGGYDKYTLHFRRPLLLLLGHNMDESLCYPEYIEPETPFHDLLNFSDCDGVIGTFSAQKLLRDFNEWKARVTEYASLHEEHFMLKTFRKIHILMKLAANDGALKFG